MSDKQTAKEFIISYFIHHQQDLKRLVQSYTTIKEQLLEIEDLVFHSDIEEQYSSIVKWVLVHNITKNVDVTVEDAILFLEELGQEALDQFLKA